MNSSKYYGLWKALTQKKSACWCLLVCFCRFNLLTNDLQCLDDDIGGSSDGNNKGPKNFAGKLSQLFYFKGLIILDFELAFRVFANKRNPNILIWNPITVLGGIEIAGVAWYYEHFFEVALDFFEKFGSNIKLCECYEFCITVYIIKIWNCNCYRVNFSWHVRLCVCVCVFRCLYFYRSNLY